MNEDIQTLIQKINEENYPFTASQKDDSTVEIMWKWKDAISLGWGEVSEEVKVFRYYVKFFPNNKYKTSNKSLEAEKELDVLNGSFGMSKKVFIGKQVGFSKEIDLFSHDKKTGNTGVNKFEFDTSDISKPVKEIMSSLGYKAKWF